MPLITNIVRDEWWVTDQVWISFRLNDFGLIYAPWTFNFGQIFSCHHFTSLYFEILTWFLVFGITMMSYRSSFFCSHWIILAKLLSLDFRILHSIQIVLQNHKCSLRGPETLLYRFEAIRNQKCLLWPLTGRNIWNFFSRTTACEDTRLADSVPSTGPQEALLLLRVFRYPTWPPRLLIGRWDILTPHPGF